MRLRAEAANEPAGSRAAHARCEADYNPKHIPSWTDRVLWRSLPAHVGRVELLDYVACDTATSSDYKRIGVVLLLCCGGFITVMTGGIAFPCTLACFFFCGGAAAGRAAGRLAEVWQ